jgi:hypothetical protein
LAIWRDGGGALCCKRSIFGDGSKMTADEIDELISGPARHFPISYDLYLAVTRDGKPWPTEHTTRLTVAEEKAGVVWTEELGRAKLGVENRRYLDDLSKYRSATEIETHAVETSGELTSPTDDSRELGDARAATLASPPDNPRAVIGGNQPPELTPAEALAARLNAVSADVVKWLGEIGGEPRTKIEADLLADYASKFSELKCLAETEHKIAKEPHLSAGRAVDALWFPLRDKASSLRKRCFDIADKWINAETARRAEEARKANEEARRRAAEAARETGSSAETVAEVKAEPVRIGNARTVSQRARAVYRVTDLQAGAAYIAAMGNPPTEFADVIEKIGRKMLDAGVKLTWIEKGSERKAV